MTWLILLFALEIGMRPAGEVVRYADPGYVPEVYNAVVYTDLEAEVVAWDTVFVGGMVYTEAAPYAWNNYAPFWTVYGFNAGARRGIFEIGWRHYCSHGVTVAGWLPRNAWPEMNGGFNQVYIRLESGR